MSTTDPVILRPATPADRDFLLRVYAESRAEELAAADWTDEEKIARLYSLYEQEGSLANSVKFINLWEPQKKVPQPIDNY